MTPKLKIIPLGGLGEIGKNMTVVEFGNDLIIIDCGMGFPDEDMYGIDVVLPDITYLRNNASRIRGMIITHGHEDHIGAVPYVLQELDVPIYTTPLTAALIELKLEEYDLLYNTQIFTKKAGSVFRVGAFAHLGRHDRPRAPRRAWQRGRSRPAQRFHQCRDAWPFGFRAQGGREL